VDEVSIAAAAGAGVALILSIVNWVRTSRLRRTQRVVLGDGSRDLVAHSARLDEGFAQLRDWVEEVLARVEEKAAAMDRRIDHAVSYYALIRYDAYGEMSGQQSSSFALLDQQRSGIVMTSIVHRDQARVYVKQLHEGRSEIDLSPEEQQAIETALARGVQQPRQAA
jgi:hypothetical protein